MAGSVEAPLIVIVGETASGKSSLAMRVARSFRSEILAADSRTIYKGMDIGTAKPTKAEQSEVPHHGLDLVAPDQRFTAAEFKLYADDVIADIRARKKVPIMVGGTGLYVDSVLFDYSFGGAVNDELRARLEAMTLDELQAEAVDRGLSPTRDMLYNKRHLIRAIERGEIQVPERILPKNCIVVGLRLNRNVLRKRAEDRVEMMFRQGLRKEYNNLKEQYGKDNEAMTGIGYREFFDYDDGTVSMSQVKRNIVKNTMNKLAKHQRTWFKRNPHIVWFDDHEEAYKKIADFIDVTYTKT